MSELYAKIYNFIVTAEEENINASTVIYQALNEEPWISKEEVRGWFTEQFHQRWIYMLKAPLDNKNFRKYLYK